MKYCILGGGGSFGLTTARYLLEQPDTERVLSIGRDLPKLPCFTLATGDNDPRYDYRVYHVTYQHDALMRVLNEVEPDVIINFAAQGEGATSFTESWRYFETNCVGLSRLVEAIGGRSWLRHFIHIGSSEVYGATDAPATEENPLRPTSPYAISKAAFDQYLLSVRRKLKFPVTILRPSNAYGPGQQLHRVIPKAFLYALTGRRIPLHGGGAAQKSYIHSRDLAAAIHALVTTAHEARYDGGALGLAPIYNLGSDKPTAIRDVVEMIALSLGFNALDQLADVVPDREHQDSRYWLSSRRAEHELGWKPRIAWDEGLDDMHRWVDRWLFMLRTLPVEFVMRP